MDTDAKYVEGDGTPIMDDAVTEDTCVEGAEGDMQAPNGQDDVPNDANMTEIELPRSRVLADAIGDVYSLPLDVEYDLPSTTTDHIEEARHECVYRFLEKVLLPRMRMDEQLSVEELVEKAQKFKDVFGEEHPKDFVGEFELIPAAELELMQLHLQYKTRREAHGDCTETAKLVEKALTQIKPLLDEYPEVLFSI